MSSSRKAATKRAAPAAAAAAETKRGKNAKTVSEDVAAAAGAPAGSEGGAPEMYQNPKYPPSSQSLYTAPNAPESVSLGFTIIYVSDMARSIAFYTKAFGFDVKSKFGGAWTELATGNTTLALHWTGEESGKGSEGKGASAAKKGAAKAAAGAEPVGEHKPAAGFNSPSFIVSDLAAFHKRVTKSVPGLVVESDIKTQGWGGQLASYRDPDGLVFSVMTMPPEGQ